MVVAEVVVAASLRGSSDGLEEVLLLVVVAVELLLHFNAPLRSLEAKQHERFAMLITNGG